MAAAAALFAASAQALPAASEWAYEELTNHLAMIVAKGGTSKVALPRFKMVLPGDAGSEAFADDFAALRDTDGYAVRRRGGLPHTPSSWGVLSMRSNQTTTKQGE